MPVILQATENTQYHTGYLNAQSNEDGRAIVIPEFLFLHVSVGRCLVCTVIHYLIDISDNESYKEHSYARPK